jgi:hypothetical protein
MHSGFIFKFAYRDKSFGRHNIKRWPFLATAWQPADYAIRDAEKSASLII